MTTSLEAERRALEVFSEALEVDLEHRVSFVAKACSAAPELERRVRELLEAHEGPADLLDTNALELVARHMASGEQLRQLERIGNYRVLGEIGAGGMGRVFRARQAHPSRDVAIKIIDAPLVSPRMRRRFEREAELLGGLRHPSIATIYETGTEGEGTGARPFFVMELIEGEALTAYVHAQNLDLRARIRLLAEICQAVHHAHQKGIVHLDLKPSNVLVEEGGRIKVLDFGIARSLDAGSGGEQAERAGTRPYMSPEQDTAPEDVDTRADVYALGVIGYELACETPSSWKAGRSAPVMRFELNRLAAHELAAVLQRATAMNPDERYASADELGSDLLRFVDHEGVHARKQRRIEALRLYARRDPVRARGIALLASVLVLSAGALFIQTQRAVRAGELAIGEAARKEAALQYMRSVFVQSQPDRIDRPAAPGLDVSLASALDWAGTEPIFSMIDQPEVEAFLRSLFGETYLSLGRASDARRHLMRARALSMELHGPEHTETLLIDLAVASLIAVEGDYQGAIKSYQAALAALRESIGAVDPRTLLALQDLGTIHLRAGATREARRHFEDALDRRRAVLGESHVDTLVTQGSLAVALNFLGELDLAEELLRDSLDGLEQALGLEHPYTLTTLNNLAGVLLDRSRVLEDEKLLREARDMQSLVYERSRSVLPANHLDVLIAGSSFFLLEADLDNPRVAEAGLRELVESSVPVHGEWHPIVLSVRQNLADVLERLDELDESAELFDDVLRGRREALGPCHKETLLTVNHTMTVLRRLDRDREAGELLERTLRDLERAKATPERAQMRDRFRVDLAVALARQNRLDEALEQLQQSLAGAEDRNDLELVRRALAFWIQIVERTGAGGPIEPLQARMEAVRAALEDGK